MTATDNSYDPKKIDNYDYENGGQSSKFRHFLWYCAGADVKLLELCPQSERIKEEGIGGIVLATGGLAFVSGSYAFTPSSPVVWVKQANNSTSLLRSLQSSSATCGHLSFLTWIDSLCRLSRMEMARPKLILRN